MKKTIIFALATVLILPISVSARRDSALQEKINKLGDEPVTTFPIPVTFDVSVGDFTDTWGEARSNGRTHEGTDIIVPRGSFISSPTDAVVTRIEETGRGGIVVWTANPGGEKFYYAHLDSVFAELEIGDELEPGDLIGFVGNTGNASGGAPHLHFGVYDDDYNASNPFARMDHEFTNDQRVRTLMQYLLYLIDLLGLDPDDFDL